MLTNNLHLRFGNKVPLNAVNLAYVPIQEATPQSSVLIASHIEKMDNNTADYYTVTLSPAATSTTYASSGMSTTLEGNSVGKFSSPIKVIPPEETASDSWLIRLQDGVVQHEIVYDPAVSGTYNSWLHDIGFTSAKRLMAFYTLQESATSKRSTYDPNYPQERLQAKAHKEKLYITGTSNLRTIQPSLYSVERININSRTILPEKIYYITEDNSSSLRGGLITPNAADAIVNVTTGDIELVGTQVAIGDEITADYTYNTSILSYRGFFETVEVSGGTKEVFRDLNLNPEFGQTYDNGQPTSDLTQQCTSIYVLPSAVYDLDEAELTGNIGLYRAVDYGEYSLIRWTSQPIQTHYQVAGFLPWEPKTSSAVTLDIVPVSGTVEVNGHLDFACTVLGTNKPIVSVEMDTLGGTINPGTVTNIRRTGSTTKWTYNAPNISTSAGTPYNINVKWEKVGSQNGVSALKQEVVPVTVTSDIGISLVGSTATSSVGRLETYLITPYITGGYGTDNNLVWTLYNGVSLSTVHGSMVPEDPLLPGQPMADMGIWGFTNYTYAGISTIMGPANIIAPDSLGNPVVKPIRMLYTPALSPDGGTTKWGYAVKVRAYSHYDLRKYGELDLAIVSGVHVNIQPSKGTVKTSTTKPLTVSVMGVNLLAGDNGAVSWTCSGVNTTGGDIVMTNPSLVSGPTASGTTAYSIYNFPVPSTSGVYTLVATSLLDSTSSFTATLSGFTNNVLSITSVTGQAVVNTTLPDVYDLEPGHEVQISATLTGAASSGTVSFEVFQDETLTTSGSGSSAYGSIYATGNPSQGIFTCNLRLPSSFMTSGIASFYVKAYYTQSPEFYDSVNLYGKTSMSWAIPATGYYNSAIPYEYILTLTNLGTSVSGALTQNGTGLSMAASSWTGGPPSVELLDTVYTTGGLFGNVVTSKIPIRVNTPFSSAGLDTYVLTVNVSGMASGTAFTNGTKTTTANRLVASINPIVSNWKVVQTSATGYAAPNGAGGYVMAPGESLILGAKVMVGGHDLTEYYSGYNLNYGVVRGITWSVLDSDHASTGTLTTLATGAMYTAPATYDPTFKVSTGETWHKLTMDTVKAVPSAVTPALQRGLLWPIEIDSMVRSVAVIPADEPSRIKIGQGLSPGDEVTLLATVYYDGVAIPDSGCVWSTVGVTGSITNLDDSPYTGTSEVSIKYTLPGGFPVALQMTDTIVVSSSYDSDITGQILIPLNFDFGLADIIPNPNIKLGKYGEAVYSRYRFSD